MSSSSESSTDQGPEEAGEPDPRQSGEVGEAGEEAPPRGRRPVIIGSVVLAAVVGMVVAWLVGGGGSDSDGETAGEFGVSDAYISVSMDVAAGYVTVDNPGPDDELIAVSSPAAATTGLMVGGGGGHDGAGLDTLAVPTGTTELYPGGDHIMLEDLPEPLEAGETVELELTFEQAGTVAVEAEVLTIDEVIERTGR